jgi:hypothetical protein
MSTTDNLTDILEMCREKMTEGDYVKTADFLRKLHDSATPESRIIVHTANVLMNTHVTFNTIKGKKTTVEIESVKRLRFRGPIPDEYTVIGTIDGEEFTMSREQFVERMARRIGFYGAKSIERQMQHHDKDVFSGLGTFKKFIQEREVCAERRDDDEDEDEWADFNTPYIMAALFGVDNDSTGLNY